MSNPDRLTAITLEQEATLTQQAHSLASGHDFLVAPIYTALRQAFTMGAKSQQGLRESMLDELGKLGWLLTNEQDNRAVSATLSEIRAFAEALHD